MSSWQKIKLGELYTVHNGLSKGRQFFGKGFPFLSFTEVFNNWFLPSELSSLVQSSEQEREACSIKRGDVFITRTSETMDELGMSSVALKDYPNATYNGFTKRLRPIGDTILPEYIGYYLRSHKFRGKFMAYSSMTTRASLANEDLLSMEVEVPDLSIQKRIATILSRYDALIQNHRTQIELLEEASRRLFSEWFIDFHFPGAKTESFIDGVPSGWKKDEGILNVFEFKYGKILPTKEFVNNGPIPVYGASKRIGWYTKANCFEPKVLVGSRGNAGYVHRTIEQETYVTNNSFIITPFEKYGFMKYPYIYELFKTLDFVAICTGAAQPQLTLNSVKSMSFTLPRKELIEEFTQAVDPAFVKIANSYQQIQDLTIARDTLLNKLVEGELSL